MTEHFKIVSDSRTFNYVKIEEGSEHNNENGEIDFDFCPPRINIQLPDYKCSFCHNKFHRSKMVILGPRPIKIPHSDSRCIKCHLDIVKNGRPDPILENIMLNRLSDWWGEGLKDAGIKGENTRSLAQHLSSDAGKAQLLKDLNGEYQDNTESDKSQSQTSVQEDSTV